MEVIQLIDHFGEYDNHGMKMPYNLLIIKVDDGYKGIVGHDLMPDGTCDNEVFTSPIFTSRHDVLDYFINEGQRIFESSMREYGDKNAMICAIRDALDDMPSDTILNIFLPKMSSDTLEWIVNELKTEGIIARDE